MPLYEGIGLINEKHAVVLDIGRAYTRCGFAGESGPRCIIPSRVADPKTKKMVFIRDYTSPDHLYCLLTEFINRLYFKYLLVNPKDRRVVLTESVFCPTVFRETLAKVLFLHYEVSSVLLAPTHLMALHTIGISSALVMDFGYEETTVLPIYEGVVMVSSAEEHGVGGRALHSRLRSLLIEHSRVKVGENAEAGVETVLDFLSEDVIEDIKVRTCFVTPMERAQKLEAAASNQNAEVPLPPPAVDYPLRGTSILHIPGTVRESAMEILFERDGEERSLATLILDCIIKSPTDIRKCLAENIVIIGGSAMIPGFQHRLLMEVKNLLTEPKYKNKTAVKTFKFHTAAAKENYAAWMGAAIFSAATDAVTLRSLSKEQYKLHGCLPDWSSPNYTSVQKDEKGI